MSTTPESRHRIAPTASIVLVMAMVLLSLVTTGPARAAGDPAASLRAHINAERSARGLAPLASASDLRAVALDHSRDMATSEHLHHNPSLGSDVRNWKVVAENVGVGPDADQLHREFMNSSSHATNILDGRITQVGVGVVQADGMLWVTQVFRQPMSAPAPEPESASTPSATPTPSAPPGPTTTSASRPVPEPQVGTAAATVTRVAPVPATVGVAAPEPTTIAPAPTPTGIEGLVASVLAWVAGRV